MFPIRVTTPSGKAELCSKKRSLFKKKKKSERKRLTSTKLHVTVAQLSLVVTLQLHAPFTVVAHASSSAKTAIACDLDNASAHNSRAIRPPCTLATTDNDVDRWYMFGATRGCARERGEDGGPTKNPQM